MHRENTALKEADISGSGDLITSATASSVEYSLLLLHLHSFSVSHSLPTFVFLQDQQSEGKEGKLAVTGRTTKDLVYFQTSSA